MPFRSLRTVTAASLFAVITVVGVGSSASSAFADDSTTKTKVVSCTGAPEHKQAQVLRLQALDLDLKAVQARLAEATANSKPLAVARINVRIARINARVAEVKARQVKLATRCP